MKFINLLAVVLIAAGNAVAAPVNYRIVVLRDPGIDAVPSWQPRAINIHGEVIANSNGNGTRPLPYYWDRNGNPHPIPYGDNLAIAVVNGINDKSEVVGSVSRGTGGVAFAYSVKKGFRRIGHDAYYTTALSINNAGMAVGGLEPWAYEHHPTESVSWTRDGGQQTLLPDPPIRFIYSSARAVNEKSHVLVQVDPTQKNFGHTGVIDAAGILTMLPENRETNKVYGVAMNNLGAVVGQTSDSYFRRAFFWEGGDIMSLGVLGSGDDWTLTSMAFAINNLGQVVGYSDYKSIENPFGKAAVYFDKSSGMLNLETLIDPSDPQFGKLQFDSAYSINDRGWILVAASKKGDEAWGERPAILIPVKH